MLCIIWNFIMKNEIFKELNMSCLLSLYGGMLYFKKENGSNVIELPKMFASIEIICMAMQMHSSNSFITSKKNGICNMN